MRKSVLRRIGALLLGVMAASGMQATRVCPKSSDVLAHCEMDEAVNGRDMLMDTSISPAMASNYSMEGSWWHLPVAMLSTTMGAGIMSGS